LNLVLRGVQKTKLQHGAGFGAHDEVVQSAPRRFELAEPLVVHDFVEAFVDFLIEHGDALVD
jgi:hypothetical protein